MDHNKCFLDGYKNSEPSVWIFGYGSILWKTGFEYMRKEFGYVTGYDRRFCQLSTTHRGTPQKPGLCATLVKGEESSVVWGAAYELVEEEMIQLAMEHLGARECKMGGYIADTTQFHPREPSKPVFSAMTFRATEDNPLYLGPAPIHDLADQIISTRGLCGHNVEYVVQLRDYIKRNIPEETDHHLFDLMDCIEVKLTERGLDIDMLVNESTPAEN